MASRRGGKQYQVGRVSNEHLIYQAITTLGLSNSSDNPAILDLLRNQEENLDTILDDGQRKERADKYGWKEPTVRDRIEYCKSQADSSSSADGRKRWLSFIDGAKIANKRDYHKLREQRLSEQIRKVRSAVDREVASAEKFVTVAGVGSSYAVPWGEVETGPIDRIPTGWKAVDKLFGTTDYSANKKSSGIAEGFSYLFGAEKGSGKTRLLTKLMGSLCGPERKVDGVDVGGGTCLYNQGEEEDGRFVELFGKSWVRGKTNIMLGHATMMRDLEKMIRDTRPKFVVVDSKDMLFEFQREASVQNAIQSMHEWIDTYKFTLFLVSHVNKAGGIKGSTRLPHLVRAVMLGSKDENVRNGFTIKFDKNRAGPSDVPLKLIHTPNGLELYDGASIKSEFAPELIPVLSPDQEDARS